MLGLGLRFRKIGGAWSFVWRG